MGKVSRGVKITVQAYKEAVQKDVALPAQDAALRQIAGLEAGGARLLECEYGPLNPDSTGSETARLASTTGLRNRA